MVGAYNAAVVMARRALQCAAVERGAPRKRPNGAAATLYFQLQWLMENGHISKQYWEWGEAIRWVGNHGAHESEPEVRDDGQPTVTAVTVEDAAETIKLVEEICRTLYVLPAMAKGQLDKRR